MTVLFGSIVLNDFIKVCIYYFNGLKEWWREKEEKEEEEEDEKQNEAKSEETILDIIDRDYVDELDENLEKVYYQLVQANARNRRNNDTSV